MVTHTLYIDSLSISAVNDMSITNARLPFWRVVGTKESRYGAIAKLYSICMLDVSTYGVVGYTALHVEYAEYDR